MVRQIAPLGLAGLALLLAACSGGSEGSAASATSEATSASATEGESAAAQTQLPPPNPEAPDPEPGQTNAQARAEELAGNPTGDSPVPEATSGARPEDMNAPRSPAEAAAAAGGGVQTTQP